MEPARSRREAAGTLGGGHAYVYRIGRDGRSIGERGPSAGHTVPFVAETLMQLPSKYKHVIETNNDGDKHTVIQIINGSKVHIILDGRPLTPDPTQLAEIRNGLELQRAQRLLPLLEDRSYQLALLDELKVNDRPAAGVRVTGRGRREMRLYFDKEYGLLVRAENRIDDGKGKELRQQFFFGDFKDVGGYKRFTKVRVYREGKKLMEAELTDAQPLERVDESEFAKP
jgi:hypothetical protein